MKRALDCAISGCRIAAACGDRIALKAITMSVEFS